MFDKHACNSFLIFYYEIITVLKINANAALDSWIFIEPRSSQFITVRTVVESLFHLSHVMYQWRHENPKDSESVSKDIERSQTRE